MPESPVFGRGKQSAPRAARAATLADEAGRNLGDFAERILLGGGLIEFAGLVVLFVATQMWPSDPAALGDLGRAIYVPAVLQDALVVLHLPFAVHTARVVVNSVGIDLTNPAVVLIAVTGFGACLRGRWWLAGPAAAFFAFPWAVVGYHLVAASVILTLLAGAALYRVYRPRLWVAIVVGLVLLFGVQAALPVTQMIERATFADTTKATYQRIAFGDLKKAEEADTGPIGARAAILAGLPIFSPAQSAAKAYAVAQELALRGDAVGALTAVTDAEAQGFGATVFDQRRITSILRYATASGVLGEAAETAQASADRMRWMIAMALAAIGVVLALFGPLSDILGRRLLRRVARLDLATSRLETQYETIARGEAETVGREAGAIRSMAVLDGQAALAAIAGRVRFYRYAVVMLLVLAAGFLLGAWWLWLPAAGDNTAFTMLSLPPQLAAMARDAGLVAADSRAAFSAFYVSTASALAPIVGVYLLLRRRKLAPVAVLLLAYSFIQIVGLAPIRHAFTEVAPAAVGQEMIATWQAGVGNPDTAVAPDALHGSEAAYGLAQLAYLAGQPGKAQGYLDRIRDTKLLGGAVHRQKIELMRDWTAAHGAAVATDSAAAVLPGTTAVIRTLSRVSLGLGLAALALVLLAAAAGLVAERRRKRIDALVAARSQADSMVARRHIVKPSAAA